MKINDLTNIFQFLLIAESVKFTRRPHFYWNCLFIIFCCHARYCSKIPIGLDIDTHFAYLIANITPLRQNPIVIFVYGFVPWSCSFTWTMHECVQCSCIQPTMKWIIWWSWLRCALQKRTSWLVVIRHQNNHECFLKWLTFKGFKIFIQIERNSYASLIFILNGSKRRIWRNKIAFVIYPESQSENKTLFYLDLFFHPAKIKRCFYLQIGSLRIIEKQNNVDCNFSSLGLEQHWILLRFLYWFSFSRPIGFLFIHVMRSRNCCRCILASNSFWEWEFVFTSLLHCIGILYHSLSFFSVLVSHSHMNSFQSELKLLTPCLAHIRIRVSVAVWFADWWYFRFHSIRLLFDSNCFL